MFSEKAKAFCIENLLGLRSHRLKDEVIGCEGVGEICPVPGQGTQCVHNSIQTVHSAGYNNKITVELCQTDLWSSFHSLGTEMIITKSGRRMFPAIRVKLSGMDPSAKYKVYLDFVQLDRHKYRYVYHSSKWMVSGTGENMSRQQMYSHPDSPLDGRLLNSQIISFERLKLTNNDRSKPGQVSLLSMQRFLPRLHVERLSSNNIPEEHFVISFLQTSFMAVTAYQNQEITRLKIARNPFAKGFRESGKNRSSLEAMIECYGLQFPDSECNSRCQRHDHKTEQVYQATALPISPLNGFPAMFPSMTRPSSPQECTGDKATKPSIHRMYSYEIPEPSRIICKTEKDNSNYKQESYILNRYRFMPYQPVCYKNMTIQHSDVFKYDTS